MARLKATQAQASVASSSDSLSTSIKDDGSKCPTSALSKLSSSTSQPSLSYDNASPPLASLSTKNAQSDDSARSCESKSSKTILLLDELVQFRTPISPPPPPPPFFMCSKDEALDRQQHFELSPFECDPSSLNRTGGSSYGGSIAASPGKTSGMNSSASTNAHTPAIKKVKPLENPRPISSLAAAASPSRSFSPASEFKDYATIIGNSNFLSPGSKPKTDASMNSYADKNRNINKNGIEVNFNTPPNKPSAPIASTPSILRAARSNRPTFHPQYVIKKYRRSAAGGGTLSEISGKSLRNLKQLSATVDYLLLSVFAWQMPPSIPPDSSSGNHADYRSSGGGGNSSGYSSDVSSAWGDDDLAELPSRGPEQTPFSLCDTVSFVDDRLRAVQKDLVTLLGNMEESDVVSSLSFDCKDKQQLHEMKSIVRKMQARMVRYSILSSYLLSGVPTSKYEMKFGARALRTALTCYLNLSLTLDEEFLANEDHINDANFYQEECETKDEMMAYMALLHSSAVMRSDEIALPPPTMGEVTSALTEESGSGWGAILSTFCKHVMSLRRNTSFDSLVCNFPRWKWALDLACMAQEGNYQRYFLLLEKGPDILSTSGCNHSNTASDRARFVILARCCASHSLNLVRLAALRRFNHAFGKGEYVSGSDLAHLLRFREDGNNNEQSAEKAITFCRDAGLPTVVKDDCGGIVKSYVVLKSAPISISEEGPISRMCNPGRLNDGFVFGKIFRSFNPAGVEALVDRLEQCDIQDVDSWEDRNCENICVRSSKIRFDANKDRHCSHSGRLDEEGVMIPSAVVLWNLIY
mmetsp:Transcript_18150/g.35282  ORF Transcript_18150/g.35282 Transcript_18150/m.35282 type:complete len:810 (+) Transcript_18150:2-2431(+)